MNLVTGRTRLHTEGTRTHRCGRAYMLRRMGVFGVGVGGRRGFLNDQGKLENFGWGQSTKDEKGDFPGVSGGYDFVLLL